MSLKAWQKIEVTLLINISTNSTIEINESDHLRSGHVCAVFDIGGSDMVIAAGGGIDTQNSNSTDIIDISSDGQLKTGMLLKYSNS